MNKLKKRKINKSRTVFLHQMRKQLNNLNQKERSTIYDIEILHNLQHRIVDEIRILKYGHYYLPNEIIGKILSYVTIKQLFKSITLVCKRWNSIAMNEDIELIKRIMYFFIHQHKIVYPEYRKTFEINIRKFGILRFIKRRIIERYLKRFEGFYHLSYKSGGFRVKDSFIYGFKNISQILLINKYGQTLFIQSICVHIGEKYNNNDINLRCFTFGKHEIINNYDDYNFFRDFII